jgi:hypothetical protein
MVFIFLGMNNWMKEFFTGHLTHKHEMTTKFWTIRHRTLSDIVPCPRRTKTPEYSVTLCLVPEEQWPQVHLRSSLQVSQIIFWNPVLFVPSDNRMNQWILLHCGLCESMSPISVLLCKGAQHGLLCPAMRWRKQKNICQNAVRKGGLGWCEMSKTSVTKPGMHQHHKYLISAHSILLDK